MQIQQKDLAKKKKEKCGTQDFGVVESMRKVGDVPCENAEKGKKMKPIGCRSPYDPIRKEIDCDTYVLKKVARNVVRKTLFCLKHLSVPSLIKMTTNAFKTS